MLSSPTVKTSLIFIAIALVGLVFADIAITAANPWKDLGRFFLGVITPDFFSTEGLATALLRTVAFAFVGVALGSISGFLLALVYRWMPVRILCAFVRAIHELFWAKTKKKEEQEILKSRKKKKIKNYKTKKTKKLERKRKVKKKKIT